MQLGIMKLLQLIFIVMIGCNLLSAQTITTIAGTGLGGPLGDGGPATAARWGGGGGIVINRQNAVIIADGNLNRVRKIDQATGIITTIAGTGTVGFSGDFGSATMANLNLPTWVACDTIGNLYIADAWNNRIRTINVVGVITTYAGNGLVAFAGDGGPATAASFDGIQGIATDLFGNLYIVDGSNVRIRKIDASGMISTVCGFGSGGFSGDGGPATAAQFAGALGICTDSAGNVYFADYGNHRVRKIDAITGIITTVAGTGAIGYTGDGIPATSSNLFNPFNVGIDIYGNLHIADYSNHRIRKVNSSGIISTVTGSGTAGFSGDGGAATTAQINSPEGVAFDACGNMYIADFNNKRIRKVTYPPILTTPTIAITGSTSMPVGSMVTVNATVTNAGSSYIIHWMNRGLEFTTTMVPVVSYVKMPGTDTITARVVPTSYGCYDSTTSTAHYVTTYTTEYYNTAEGLYIVCPNPASEVLTIGTMRRNTTYELWNLMGAVMQYGSLKQGTNNIVVKQLPPGLYMLLLTDEEGKRMVHKVVKE